MNLERICMKVGDRRPVLRVQLGYRGEPTPQTSPLTGATAVKLRMVHRESRTVKIDDAAATIESIQARTVSYAWGATDTTEPGEYEAWFRVEYGSADVVQSFPSCGGFLISIE